MNRYIYFSMKIIWAIVACLVVTACDSSSLSDESLGFSDKKYPLVFAAQMSEMRPTRATTDGVWEGTELVAVKNVDMVKQYKMDVNGELSSADPYYWQNMEESKLLTAWYPYSEVFPQRWSVEADQHTFFDGQTGYQKSDLLYAPLKEYTFNSIEESANALVFYHQTARVVINILRLETVEKVEDVESVTIGDGENLFPLTGGLTITGEEKEIVNWEVSDIPEEQGYIIPHRLSVPNVISGIECLSSYVALVIPQDMVNKKFIAVTLPWRTYYYVPKAGEANLEAGKEYVYTIIVKDPSLEVISSDPSWIGNDEDVIPTPMQ